MSVLWPDWPEGDDNVEYADPRESYAVVDVGVMYVPADLVGIVRCPVCSDDYANRAFLREHQATAHPGAAKNTAPGRSASGTVQERPTRPERPRRPASVPAPVDAAKVRPLRPETESASRSLRPEPEAVPPARVPNPRARRRGAQRSKPRHGK